LFAASLLLCAIATFIGYQNATEDFEHKNDIDKCSMAPEENILSASKLIKAFMYLGLLACFRVPFNRIIKQIRSSDNISVDKLQTVSNKVFLQISLPIVVYCICAIIGFALNSWNGYTWISYTLQDLSIFVAMSFTYAMAERENSDLSSHDPLPSPPPPPSNFFPRPGSAGHLFQHGAAMSPTQSSAVVNIITNKK
jgi:hypothetical protein